MKETLDTILDPLQLLLRGKLVREPLEFFLKAGVGAALSVIAFLILSRLGMSIWLGLPISAFLGGAIQPHFFRDIRFA